MEKENTFRIKDKIYSNNNNILINNNNNYNYINHTKIYKDGKYVGQFKDNLRDRRGIMQYNNGKKYNGD